MATRARDLAAAGEQLAGELASQLVELGAQALDGAPFPAILAGGAVERLAEPREVEDLADAPVRGGDLGGRDGRGGGDVDDVERRAQAFEPDAGLGERQPATPAAASSATAGAPALRLGGGQRALDDRDARHGSARPSARAGRCSDRWRAASGRRARARPPARRDSATSPSGPRLAGARRERPRVGERLDHDEGARHLGAGRAALAHRAGEEGRAHEIDDAVGERGRDQLAPQPVDADGVAAAFDQARREVGEQHLLEVRVLAEGVAAERGGRACIFA